MAELVTKNPARVHNLLVSFMKEFTNNKEVVGVYNTEGCYSKVWFRDKGKKKLEFWVYQDGTYEIKKTDVEFIKPMLIDFLSRNHKK